MPFLRVVRFFRGEVAFSVSGGRTERFINLCAASDVPLWHGRKNNGEYSARTSLSASGQLAALADRAGVRLRISGRTGIPCLILRYHRRRALLAGVVVLLAALMVMSGFIWKIEVTGCEDIQVPDVMAALDALGVRPGVWRRSVDTRNVERRLLISFDKAAWVGVNLTGSTARVEIQERVEPPALIDDDVPHNVLASRTGYIVRMEVYSGQAVVKVGDTVSEGDILVSGITEDKNGSARLLHARASVFAQHTRVLSVMEPYEEELYSFSGRVIKRRYLALGELELPLFLGGSLPELRKTERAAFSLPVIGAVAPVSLVTEYVLPLEAHTVSRTRDEARIAAQEALDKMAAGELAGMEILSQNATGQELEDGFLLECSYLCVGNIGIENKILTE